MSAGVPPDNKLGENAGAAIGQALEKNTSLVKLNLTSAPLVFSFWLVSHVHLIRRFCFSVIMRCVSVRLMPFVFWCWCGACWRVGSVLVDVSRIRCIESDLVCLVG